MTERRAAQALPAFLPSLERTALVDAARTTGECERRTRPAAVWVSAAVRAAALPRLVAP